MLFLRPVIWNSLTGEPDMIEPPLMESDGFKRVITPFGNAWNSSMAVFIFPFFQKIWLIISDCQTVRACIRLPARNPDFRYLMDWLKKQTGKVHSVLVRTWILYEQCLLDDTVLGTAQYIVAKRMEVRYRYKKKNYSEIILFCFLLYSIFFFRWVLFRIVVKRLFQKRSQIIYCDVLSNDYSFVVQ